MADARVADVLTHCSDDPLEIPRLVEDATLDTHIAQQRGVVRDTFLTVVDRCRGVTGLDVGPGAHRLVDELVAAAYHELPRLLFLKHAEAAVFVAPVAPLPESRPEVALTEAELRATLRNATDVATMVGALDRFDATERPNVARHLLRFGTEEGTTHEVLTVLRAIASGTDDPLDEGVKVAVFAEDASLPAPGELVELGESNAVPAGRYKVIGFGNEPQTIRVRPPRPDELPDADAVGQVGGTSTYTR